MRSFLTALVSAAALFGLAACGDADDTTTQSVEPADDPAIVEEPETDDTTTQGLEPYDGGAADDQMQQ